MFQSIVVTDRETYEPLKGDWIVYVGSVETDVNPNADYNLWFEYVDIAATPKEIADDNFSAISWGKHVTPLRRAIKAANGLKKPTRLVFMSNDHEVDAMALALATSECNIFSGKFTQELFDTYYIKSIDTRAFVEYLGLMSALYDQAKKFLPTKVKICTRYELLGNLTSREIVHLICVKHMGRDYKLIEGDVGVLDNPQPIKKVRK